MTSSRLLFLRESVTNFHATGAVGPSSKALARLMVRTLEAGGERVVELGPGTGVFTAELLRAGVVPENLLLVERNERFVAVLRQRFPGVTVIHGDAGELPAILGRHGIATVPRVISGLPFRSLPSAAGNAIARALGTCVAPHGHFIQFTYALKPPLSAEQAASAGLSGRCIGLVLGNLPPAFCWRYNKQGEPRSWSLT